MKTNYKPIDRICSNSDISESFWRENAKFRLKEQISSKQDDSENSYSDLTLEFDDSLDKEKEQFEKLSTTENDSLLNSVELSGLEVDDMSLEQEIEASKASFDRIASLLLAKPTYDNNKKISD